MFSISPSIDPASEAARLARVALIQDPTAVEAISVLGLQAQLRNDVEGARRIFGHSLALSRRELQPQLWVIEEAVDRGDIVGALSAYDVALRTSRNADAILFPTLASAIGEPKVRTALVNMFATRPIWERKFVYFLASGGGDPRIVLKFFEEGKRTKLIVDDADRARVVNSLVTLGHVAEAWDYYSTFRRDVTRSRSRDPEFRLVSDVSAPFDWVVVNDGTISASILPTEAGGIVDFAVPSSMSGPIISQMQMLPAGRYRLQGRSKGVDQPERSRPYWSLVCADGRELGRVPLNGSEDDGGVFTGRFTVPSGCDVQTLTLVAKASDDFSGVTGSIVSALLSPAVP